MNDSVTVTPDHILQFWFEELTPKDWWKKSDRLDRDITERFGTIHEQACRCEVFPWRATPAGRLAEIIVLDQFSRNIFRDTPNAFAADPLALALAQEAVDREVDRELDPARRAFLYMPYMHSESRLIHEEAVELFSGPGLEDNLKFEKQHKVIIDRFGRYPHRNTILNRPSSPEEEAFLKEPGSSF